jgi:hypothetical protein
MDSPRRSLRAADLLSLDVTADELRGPGWRSPFHGIHVPAGTPTDPSTQRILDAAELVPPAGAVVGWAAGRLLGAAELDGRGRSGTECEPVVIGVRSYQQHAAPRVGVRFVRSRFTLDDVVEVRGIPVSSPVRTTFDLMRWHRPEDALVHGDLMARWTGVTHEEVGAYAKDHRRYRGVPVVRRMLPLVDPAARSTGESRLRYIWVVDAGLAVPACNPYLVDQQGTIVGMSDLLDTEFGLAGEYDGSTHRDLAEHTADNTREEGFEGLGVVVVRATSLDVTRHRSRTVDRLLDGRQRARDITRRGARTWGWAPSPPWRPRSQPVDW